MGEFTGGELKRISGIFIKRIEDHRKELLSPVTGRDGVMYSELSDGIMQASIVIPVIPSFAMNTISPPDSPVPSR